MAPRPLLLRNRNLLYLWLGQVGSQAGSRIYQIAILWWILGSVSTGAGRWSAFFLVAAALPGLLFVKPIGALIDRWNRKSILLASDAAALAVVVLVGFLLETSRFTPTGAVVAAFGLALFQAIIDPALNRAVSEVVPESEIPGAVAILSSTQSLANFGGAVLGAALLGALGVKGVVWLNAASYGLSFVCNLRLRLLHSSHTERGANAATTQPEIKKTDLFAKIPLVRTILILFGWLNFFATPQLLILPLYAKFTLKKDATSLAGLEAALWFGLLLGTFIMPKLGWERRPLRSGALCIAGFGLCLLAPGIWISFGVYAASLAVAGLLLGMNNVTFLSLFQEVVPDENKGRFFALMQALISFAFPAAFFLFGALADRFSPPQVTLAQGIGVLLLSLGIFALWSREEELLAYRRLK